MKKRILSMVCSLAIVCTMMMTSVINAEASDTKPKKVDGSYLTEEESSTGTTSDRMARGYYLMDGVCTISKAGLTRVYAYASTTANQEVEYMATIVYVDQYQEDLDEWWQVDWWMEESHDDVFLSTAKVVTVDRGYYYRVRANHIAGTAAGAYDESASVTDGIMLP